MQRGTGTEQEGGDRQGQYLGGGAQNSLLAFEAGGPSRIPLESLSSHSHSGAVEHRESHGEACLSGVSGGKGLAVGLADRAVLTEHFREQIRLAVLLQPGESLRGVCGGSDRF